MENLLAEESQDDTHDDEHEDQPYIEIKAQ